MVVPLTVSETAAGASAAAAAQACAGIYWARSSNTKKNDSSFTLLCMLFPHLLRFFVFLVRHDNSIAYTPEKRQNYYREKTNFCPVYVRRQAQITKAAIHDDRLGVFLYV